MEASVSPGRKANDLKPTNNLPEKIPFALGAHLRIRSIEDPTVKAQTTVVGVLPNIAVLVEDPVFTKEDRIAGRVGGDIVCAYFQDGCLFKFKSRFGLVLVDDFVCIDYPKSFEAQQLRAHPRIRVNLEVVSVIGKEGKLINGDIKDISEGGCLLHLPGVIPLTTGIPVCITFVLPNDDSVENLECIIMNIRHVQEEKRTDLGLKFCGPDTEVETVKKFCEMCMYFRV